MKRREILTAMVCALAAAAAPAMAEDKLINDPNAGWVVYGQQTNKRVKDKNVQGGYAIEVKTSKGGNPWESAAHTEITEDIKSGDKIMAAMWMRAVTEDGAPARLNVRIQVNAAPYTGLV